MPLLFCILFLIPKDTCRESYFREIFDRSKGADYFLLVSAKQAGKKESTIVLSRVELSDNLNKKGYILNEEIKSKIQNGGFVLPIDDSSKLFAKVNYFTEVNKAKLKGQKYFIKNYFDDHGYLKNNVPFKLLGHIIKVLFDWNILISEVEENVYISKKRICK